MTLCDRFVSFMPTYLFVLARLPRLLLTGPLSFPGRELLRTLAGNLHYRRAAREALAEAEFPFAAAWQQLVLVDPREDPDSVKLLELYHFGALMKSFNVVKIFEIGTSRGRSSINFAANLPGHGTVRTLDVGDYWDPAYDVTPWATKVERLTADSTMFDFGPLERSADLVFIDGDHSYRAVLSDSMNALRLVTAGGLIVWHDFQKHDGVTNALLHLHRTDARFTGLRLIRDTSLAILATPHLN